MEALVCPDTSTGSHAVEGQAGNVCAQLVLRRYELAAGVTQQQMEVFDAELMQRYQPLPVDAKSGKRGAGKPAAGAKPSAANGTAGQGAATVLRSVAPQPVPTAPGTPVSTGKQTCSGQQFAHPVLPSVLVSP